MDSFINPNGNYQQDRASPIVNHPDYGEFSNDLSTIQFPDLYQTMDPFSVVDDFQINNQLNFDNYSSHQQPPQCYSDQSGGLNDFQSSIIESSSCSFAGWNQPQFSGGGNLFPPNPNGCNMNCLCPYDQPQVSNASSVAVIPETGNIDLNNNNHHNNNGMIKKEETNMATNSANAVRKGIGGTTDHSAKLEEKRKRNREAARRCRDKKLNLIKYYQKEKARVLENVQRIQEFNLKIRMRILELNDLLIQGKRLEMAGATSIITNSDNN